MNKIKPRFEKRDLLLALAVGLEPTTDRLTADCSTTELRQNGETPYT